MGPARGLMNRAVFMLFQVVTRFASERPRHWCLRLYGTNTDNHTDNQTGKYIGKQCRKLDGINRCALGQNVQDWLGCRGAATPSAVLRFALSVAFFGMFAALTAPAFAQQRSPSGQSTARHTTGSEPGADAASGAADAQASEPADALASKPVDETASVPASVPTNLAQGVASTEPQQPRTASAARSPYYYTETRRSWYGWQVLLVDVPLLSVFFFTLREKHRTVGYTSLALYGFGGPIVHGAHQRWIPAAVSGLTRLTVGGAALVTGSWVGGAFDRDASDDKTRAAVTLVAGLGVSLLDSLLLGYKDVEQQVILSATGRAGSREDRKTAQPSVWWVPSGGLLPAGGWMGVCGGF